MPNPTEAKNIRLPPSLDRRRSALTDADREAIRQSPATVTGLAKLYGVSRRLIQFIRNPAALAQNLAAREARGGWRQYYSTEAHAKATQRTRQHRRKHAADLVAPPPSVGITELPPSVGITELPPSVGITEESP